MDEDILEVADVHEEKLFQLRMYDKYDGYWINITEAVTLEAAQEAFNAKTHNGTRNTRYEDGHYYAVFPAATRMLHTPQGVDD